MNVWVLALGEPLETDLGNQRPHRAGMLSRYLVDQGHNVIFWTSNQDHYKKTLRTSKTTETIINSNFRIVQLQGRLYKKNISLQRIMHNFDVTGEFKSVACNYQTPDIIVCHYPILELCNEAINFANKNNIPSIVDVRDFWPDIFYEVLPRPLRFLGNIVFYPWIKLANKIFENVTTITGISDESIVWARLKINQDKQIYDKSFPLAYDDKQYASLNSQFLIDNKINQSHHSVYSFFGNLSSRIELKTLTNAAKLLEKEGLNNVRIVICGAGDMIKYLKDQASKCSLIILPGWVNKSEIKTLLKVSRAGLLPYPSSLDFVRSYPNKVGEYLSQGLPILSSVKGTVQQLLKEHNCGITYKNNSAQSLVEAIKVIEKDSNYRELMRENAKLCFNKKFNANIVYSDYVKYIEQVSKIDKSKI